MTGDERPATMASDHRGNDMLESHPVVNSRGSAFIGEEVLIEPVLEGVEQGAAG